MDCRFNTAAHLEAARGAAACACTRPGRRLFTQALAGAALAGALPGAAAQTSTSDGVRPLVGAESRFAQLVPAEQVEQAGTQQYLSMKREAAAQHALAPDNHPQLVRLRYIAQRVIPHTTGWNPRAADWRWEVNLFGSPELNAFCMPGGKIAFYYGILKKLQLSDNEVAMIMGHEMAHALREHARERMGKTAATRVGAGVLSALLGLGSAGDTLLNMGGQLLTLKFSREDESEADLVGLELAARAGYDPRGGISLWNKMLAAAQGAPPQFLSTHPAGATRIRDIEATLPRVMPLYAQADKPPQRYGPPKA